MSRKKRIFEIIQIGNRQDVPSRICDYVIVATIIVNIAVMIMMTFDSLNAWDGLLRAVDAVTICIFITEYALRIWTSEYLFPESTKRRAAFKFITSFDGIIELLTILPFFFLTGFVAFRLLRVVRVFHLFRVNQQFDAFNVITSVLYEKKDQLLSSVFIILVLMLASSLCMYTVEHEAQPEAFQNAFSGIWWSMSTMFTIGYGDVYPITIAGRVLAIIIAFLGVGAVAIPTGIISAGFVEKYNRTKREDVILHRMVVDIDSGWIGLSADEIEQQAGQMVVLVRRDGELFRPDDGYRVQMHDHLAMVNRLAMKK